MKLPPTWMVVSVIGALAMASFGFAALDRYASYRSPLRRDAAGNTLELTPYQVALERLASMRAERAEADRQRQALLANLTSEKMVELGREIVHGGQGYCLNCHSIGVTGNATQGPNLEDIGNGATTRVAGLSAPQYLAQSLYEPETFVVAGFAPTMPVVTKPPIGLDDVEVLLVIAYLETLGGTSTVEPETDVRALVPQ